MPTNISVVSASLLIAISAFLGHFGYHVAPNNTPVDLSSPTQVGSVIPIATSFYNDSLQAGITPTQTTLTLVSGKDSSGVSLSGEYGFVIDQGTAVQEIVLCTTVSGVNASGCTRGINLTTGTSSVAALEQTHNRGATVQITTAPIVNILANIMRGIETINQPINYDSTVSTTTLANGNSKALADVEFVNFVGSSGCANASVTDRGCVQVGTTAQVASTTSNGSSGALLVIPTSMSTSSNDVAGLHAVITQNNGTIKNNQIDQTAPYSWTGQHVSRTSAYYNATTSIAASSSVANALILNNVPYAYPSTQGASSSVMENNGSGGLFSVIPDWILLTSTTTSVAESQIATASFASSTHLRVYVYMNGEAGTMTPQLRFNVDTGANYGWYYFTSNTGVTGAGVSNDTSITAGNSTTSPGLIVADIYNGNTTPKYITYQVSQSPSSVAPMVVNGSAVWNNTAQAITKVVLINSGATTFNSGARIEVYGSNF